MTGKFHSHITIEADTREAAEQAARLINGKVTVIDLGRDDRQHTDRMITNHYVTGYRGLETHEDVLQRLNEHASILQDSGFTVVRSKLEYELLDPRSTSDVEEALATDYIELHIKWTVDPLDLDYLLGTARRYGWAVSNNPDEVLEARVVQFITRRFAGADRSIERIQSAVMQICNTVLPCLRQSMRVSAEGKVIWHTPEFDTHYEAVVWDSNADYDLWWIR